MGGRLDARIGSVLHGEGLVAVSLSMQLAVASTIKDRLLGISDPRLTSRDEAISWLSTLNDDHDRISP